MEQNHQQIGEGVEPIAGLESTNSSPTEETKAENVKPEQPSMESLLGEEGLQLDFPSAGEIRTGVIASIGENEILVSVGAKSEGVISGREFDSIPAEDREEFEILWDAHLLEKAIYELGYELNNRPQWVGIPVEGILEIMGK